jgi:hypothetical protein
MNKRALRAPRFAVASLECFERPVTLRLPFRFGAATVSQAPQAFVRATIRGTDGRVSQGMAAELMIPKWFDKSSERSNAANIDDLRASLALACDAYCANSAPRTAFGHAAFHYRALLERGAAQAQNALTMSYGAALVDRAILDALCRMRDVSIGTAFWLNLPGLGADLTPDLAHFDFDEFLSALPAPSAIDARHTVGMADPLTDDEVDAATAPDDDLPVSLAAVIARYRNRWFKIKLRGDIDADIARLIDVASVLDPIGSYRVSLDGNEQFADVPTLSAFLIALRGEARLARFAQGVVYLEQPLPRAVALDTDVHALAADVPLIIDESDATLDAFPQARARGYGGVSSKTCKGVYKSLLNAARCARFNATRDAPRAFMTGEDLTAQPGLAVQQDLALAGLLGLSHVERNGHHYAAGFDGQHAGVREQQMFAAAHPDLYEAAGDRVRLAIHDGRIAIASLAVRGFASSAWPDVETMQPMGMPSSTANSRATQPGPHARGPASP